jgi:hypothetical protein|tara:strand:+ start:345 stop:602 length:258 start_codon:yes stop_codon:yes gene_type:complete
MVIDKKAMIAAFLEEMNDLNNSVPIFPSRKDSETEFKRLLQLNVDKGAYTQEYCDVLVKSVILMDDEEFSGLCERMRSKYPGLGV